MQKVAAGEPIRKMSAPSAIMQSPSLTSDDPEFSIRDAIRWSLLVVALSPVLFVASSVLTVLTTVLAQYSAQLLINLVDALRGQISRTSVETQAILYFAVSVALVAARYGGRVLTGWSSAFMTARLQQRLHDRLLELDSNFHDRHEAGELSSIVLQSSGGAQQMFSELVAFPLVQGIPLIAALWFLLSNLGQTQAISGTALLIIGVLLLSVPIVGWRMANLLRRAASTAQGALVALNSEFLNSASSPLEVRTMGAMPQRAEAFAARLRAMVAARIATTVRLAASSEFGLSLPVLISAGLLLYAAFAMTEAGSTASAGSLVGIVLFIPFVMNPIQNLLSFNTGLQASWPLIAQVGTLLDARPAVPPGTIELKDGNPVKLDDICLAYGETRRTLDGLSYVFPPNQITAIIGRSGSGKSSILNLINGNRQPTNGAITLGGVPVLQARPDDLRRRVATVSQFPMFINDTARENFRLAKADATDAEIEAVAGKTGLWSVLQGASPTAPLDLMIPRSPGQGLSGGQRRLFAITRALLCKPDVMLLDEPTTGADPIGVAALAEGLRRWLAGLTVLIVEHDMSFVQRVADNICCLQDGQFIETGTTTALSQAPSIFSQLLSMHNAVTSTEGLSIESVPLPEISGAKRKELG